MYRTGLTVEAAQSTGISSSSKMVRRRFGKAYITDTRISRSDSRRVGAAAGRYITIEGEPHEHVVTLLLQKALEQMLPREGLILAAGLGNPDVARDSLGARTVELLGCYGRLVAMETDIAAKTGIETARMVKAVAKELKVSCVLVIDALACRDPLKIGRTVQISDTGLRPGSGVFADSPALTKSFIGAPIVAVGVPMVSELSGITGNKAHKGYLAAPPDEDELTRQWAQVIAEAVNGITCR
ncbi:MAG: GPR endopeptidase [Ruminococcaceae bacterium]|nr:GPR endopeptidase [Oscillospiraceae bacterium]